METSTNANLVRHLDECLEAGAVGKFVDLALAQAPGESLAARLSQRLWALAEARRYPAMTQVLECLYGLGDASAWR